MSESSAEERTGTAKKPGESKRLANPPRWSPWDFQNKQERTGTAKKPGESERLDNPPRWSPWDFQNKQSDWHENFYRKMRSRVEIAGDDLS
jgi:hypothetical protein